MSQPTLFYSNRCTHSRQILQTLDTLNKASLVNAVCVDTVPRHQLPPFLKSVPTLYNPETKDTIVGQAIYGYIAKPVTARTERPVNAGPGIASQGGPGAAPGGGEPVAWGLGGGGLSDSFSFWDKPTQFAMDDQSQYTFLGGASTNPAGPGGGSMPQNLQQRDSGGGSDDIQKRLAAMQQQREKEFTAVSRQ